MSKVWFTSDWHIGHRNILKYRPIANTIPEHDKILFEGHKATVGKRDTTYFLGDMFFEVTDYAIQQFSELKGTKILLLGNHDYANIKHLLPIFDDIIGPIKYKGHWLSHHPIHPQELYGKRNIHGHTHNQSVMTTLNEQLVFDTRYVNVCPDVNNNLPISFEEICKI